MAISAAPSHLFGQFRLPSWQSSSRVSEMVKTAIRTGNRPDRPLVRLMAFDWYKNISDEDMDDLVAFLRTLKPVKTE